MQTRNYYKILGYSSILGLMMLLLALFCPIEPKVVEAVSSDPVVDGDMLTTKVFANSVVSIAVENQVDLEIMPQMDGSFSSAKSNIRVATNNRDGYALYLRTVDEEGKLRNLNDTTVSATVDPIVSEAVSESDIASNAWGYSLDGQKYNGLSANDTIIYANDKAVEVENRTLYIGAKIDTALPAGVYAGQIVISAVTNPMTVTNIAALRDMQSMTSDICETTPAYVSIDNYATTQLTDLRDGKSYWVGKLKDGHCWMQQNLSLDLDVDSDGNAVAKKADGSTTVLTSNNTNIATAENGELGYWNAETGLTPVATSYTVPKKNASAANNQAYSWSANENGDVILLYPASTTTCSDLTSGSLAEMMTQCENVYQIITDGMESVSISAKFDPNTITSNVAAVEGDAYDAHYLIGNWYQWGAATAGTAKAATKDGVVAKGSICPKGWRLPTTSEQQALLTAYGAETTSNGGLNKAVAAPIYTVRGGNVDPWEGHLRRDSTARYWLGAASSTSTASIYGISSAVDLKGASNQRGRGLSVRCIAE